MPIIKQDDYIPNFFFRNGDINSIIPSLFRKPPQPEYHRIRLNTPDLDFLDLDTVFNSNDHLVILCHGLEGSSHSQYILSLSSLLSKNGYDTLAINFRSCSGEMNKNLRMYHSGETSDLDFVIKQYKASYTYISLIGFSLGGNVVLKYLGDKSIKKSSKLKSAAAVSVPCDLYEGVKELSRFRNWPYEKKFLSSLYDKLIIKQTQFPEHIDLTLFKKIKSVFDYDDYFTGPIHGFDGAVDYYTKSSSKQFLSNINIPTFYLTAMDDPFLPPACYPFSEAEKSEHLYLLATKYGGHVGYTSPGKSYYWSDHIILRFLNGSLV